MKGRGKLNKNSPKLEDFSITNSVALCVWGMGAFRILRKLGEGPYIPMTDSTGEPLEFYGSTSEVVFNSEITNAYPQARFCIELIDGASLDYIVAERG